LEERGEREISAVRLLREGIAQILYLNAHRRGSAVATWFSISRELSEPESSWFVSTSQLQACWNCARTPRQSIFRLESEIRHVTNAREIRHFTTLLNSGMLRRWFLAPGLLW
jgi:hypothetical protein